MIPKTIHYIWFGGREKPVSVLNQIEQWKKKLPDYQIKEWNEETYDFQSQKNRYVQEALNHKMWAFVSDYVRLDVLNREGGIYLDTDVEILKTFDDLLEDSCGFLSMESEYAFSTAVIGSSANQRWLEELLDDYFHRDFKIGNNKFDMTPNSKYLYNFFSKRYGFQNNLVGQEVGGIMIYPATYFSPINFATKKNSISTNTYTIHHYSGTWKSKTSKIKDIVILTLTIIFGEKIVEKLKKIVH